jgi:hypothetical protein
MSGIQVASGKFSTATGEAEVTRLESEVSFLQVKATMSLKEHIKQVKTEICDNRRQIAHVRLESLAGAENPYSLMQVFGRGHQITRNGATVYVTKCQAVELVPPAHGMHKRDSGHVQRHRGLCGSHQPGHKDCSSPGEMQ